MTMFFGYGTLRNDYYPERQATFAAEGYMTGHELWVMRGPPGYGIWAGVQPGNGRVFGHLFVPGPGVIEGVLDRREQCRYGRPDLSTYHREKVEVITGGKVVKAWCYLMAAKAIPTEIVESGNWDDRPEWLDARWGRRIMESGN